MCIIPLHAHASEARIIFVPILQMCDGLRERTQICAPVTLSVAGESQSLVYQKVSICSSWIVFL